MSESFRYYRVIETESMSAEDLQKALNQATENEMQIDHVVGTKIILGFESALNQKGRAMARTHRILSEGINKMSL